MGRTLAMAIALAVGWVVAVKGGDEQEASQPAARDPATRQLAREVRDKGWIVFAARSAQGDWDLFLYGQGWTQLWRADAAGRSRQLVYSEDGRHVYGGHVSPDGQYALFTGNMEENGDPSHSGAPMGLMRLADGPIIGGPSRALRKLHSEAKSGPVLTLPEGWEPCWTLADIGKGASQEQGNRRDKPDVDLTDP